LGLREADEGPGDAPLTLHIGEEVAGTIATYFSKRENFRTPAEFFGERYLPKAELPVRRYFAEEPEDRLRHAYVTVEPADRLVFAEDLDNPSNPTPTPRASGRVLPSATALRAYIRYQRDPSPSDEHGELVPAPPSRRPIQQRSATADRRTLRRNRAMRSRTTRLLLSLPSTANPANGVYGMSKDWQPASLINPNRGADRLMGVVPQNNIMAGRAHRRRKVTLYSRGPVPPVVEESTDMADLGAVRQELGKRASLSQLVKPGNKPRSR
jgi:hypothetical protein